MNEATRPSRLIVGLLTAGGLGLLRPAPGTWGSLPGPILALGFVALLGPSALVDVNLALVGLIFAIVCVRFGREAEQLFGKKDASQIVADEVAGVMIPLLALPWRVDDWRWNAMLAGIAFVTFRFFDITKLPPINRLQRIPLGWGVLIDDLVAGVYAAVVTQMVVRLVFGA